MAEEITKAKLLLVEGRSDEILFDVLLSKLEIEGVQVKSVDGKDSFRSKLQAIINSPGFHDTVTSLGIVRDADDSSDNAFVSICDTLALLKLPTPTKPMEISGSNPRVTVLIVPDGEPSGAIEDVCLASVADDPVMVCVDDYLDCVYEKVANPPNNQSKAKVQAFLASRPRPDMQLGRAASAGYWDWNHAAFEPLKQLLRML
ncbi:MAG: hypothetical protein IIC22_00785 [Chloroflexi bacterium]|nr:hypothetical protein [Chloroflexota bacterium]